MAYIIASILSLCILGSAALLGYRLFNWALSTGKTFTVLGIYVGVCAAAFILAFVNGLVGNVLAHIKGDSVFGLIVGILWAGIFVAIALYPWFKPPYTTGLIVVRIAGSLFCLVSALWVFIMVGLMNTKQ